MIRKLKLEEEALWFRRKPERPLLSIVLDPERVFIVPFDVSNLVSRYFSRDDILALRLVCRRFWKEIPHPDEPDSWCMHAIQYGGNLDFIKLMQATGCMAEERESSSFNYTALGSAAYWGRHDIVLYLLEHARPFDDKNIYWGAAFAGDHELMDLAISRGFNINAEYAYVGAAKNGDVITLSIMYSQHHVPLTKEIVCKCQYESIMRGNRGVVQFFISLPCEMGTVREPTCIPYAAKRGDIELMDWLHNHGFPMTPTALCWAVIGNAKKAFKWLVMMGCPANDLVIANIKNYERSNEMLEIAVRHKFPGWEFP